MISIRAVLAPDWRKLLVIGSLFANLFVPFGSARAMHETVLYSFCGQASCADGATPGTIVYQSGTLFGTTAYGANTACGTGAGCGVIYSLVPGGAETVLYTFCSMAKCKDGAVPNALIADGSGNLFGTAAYGGNCEGACGVVFELTAQGTQNVLYEFCSQSNCTDGYYPLSLTADGQGNFYGTTLGGGSPNSSCPDGCGTVFKLAADGTETVLYSFCREPNCSDGLFAFGLVLDTAGNVYGTTAYGGDACTQLPNGCGTAFKLSPDGTETVLHAFTNGADGGLPNGELIIDSAGNLYGTTAQGGTGDCNSGLGCGTVFKLAPDGTETVLYAFTGGSDGSIPGWLLRTANGGFLGTTSAGGDLGCTDSSSGCGTVFKLSPDNTEKVLYAFKGPKTDGAFPGVLIAGSAGNLYGATGWGGRHHGCFYKRQGCGTVFELQKK